MAAVPPYAEYWTSYQGAKAVNEFGSKFGPAGSTLSHGFALIFVPLEAEGLTIDIVIDWIKGHTCCKESIFDEGVRAYINPFHAFLPPALKGPQAYLPGLKSTDKGIDFEW